MLYSSSVKRRFCLQDTVEHASVHSGARSTRISRCAHGELRQSTPSHSVPENSPDNLLEHG
jgi:hypothetical protein